MKELNEKIFYKNYLKNKKLSCIANYSNYILTDGGAPYI
jgi:hypothetical protein